MCVWSEDGEMGTDTLGEERRLGIGTPDWSVGHPARGLGSGGGGEPCVGEQAEVAEEAEGQEDETGDRSEEHITGAESSRHLMPRMSDDSATCKHGACRGGWEEQDVGQCEEESGFADSSPRQRRQCRGGRRR